MDQSAVHSYVLHYCGSHSRIRTSHLLNPYLCSDCHTCDLCSVLWLWSFAYLIFVFQLLPLKRFVYIISILLLKGLFVPTKLYKCFGLTNYPWLFCIPYTLGIIFLTLSCAYSCLSIFRKQCNSEIAFGKS